MILARAYTSRAPLGLVAPGPAAGASLRSTAIGSPQLPGAALGLAAVLVAASRSLAIVLVGGDQRPGQPARLVQKQSLRRRRTSPTTSAGFRVLGVLFSDWPLHGGEPVHLWGRLSDSWQLFCPRGDRPLSHRILTICWLRSAAEERGSVPLPWVVFFLVLMIRRCCAHGLTASAWTRPRRWVRPPGFSSTALFLYLLGFHMVSWG